MVTLTDTDSSPAAETSRRLRDIAAGTKTLIRRLFRATTTPRDLEWERAIRAIAARMAGTYRTHQ